MRLYRIVKLLNNREAVAARGLTLAQAEEEQRRLYLADRNAPFVSGADFEIRPND